MIQAAQKRWDWINAFLAATLHAAIEYLRTTKYLQWRSHRGLRFQDFTQAYARQVQVRLQGVSLPALPRTLSPEEIRYIFHLEGEVWGNHWGRYTPFLDTATTTSNGEILETFRFVMTFFLIDRCLNLFLPEPQNLPSGNCKKKKKKRKRSGRGLWRRYLFGRKDTCHPGGIFSVHYPHLLEAMGPPFFLRAGTRRVEALSGSRSDWVHLQTAVVSPDLQRFYLGVTNGKHNHFAPILAQSFIRARQEFLVRKFKKNKKRLPPQTYAWWYDVLWHYSESMRYRAVLPSQHAQTRPFFWNRSIRWFASMTVTGLLNIVARQASLVKTEWQRMQQRHPVLGPLYAGVTRF